MTAEKNVINGHYDKTILIYSFVDQIVYATYNNVRQ